MDYTMYKPNDASFSNANIMLTRHCPCDVKTSGGTCPYTDHNSDIPCANEYPHLTLYYDVVSTSASTRLWKGDSTFGPILIDDEIFINTDKPYQYNTRVFPTLGIHKVKLYNKKNKITSIVNDWFRDATRLVKVEGCQDVTGVTAFQGCTNLQSIDLTEKCQEYGISAFQNCSKLTDFGHTPVVLNPSSHQLKWTVNGGHNLRNSGVEEIVISAITLFDAQHIFEDCKKLKKVTFTGGCTNEIIAWEAFSNCISLETFILDNVIPPTIGSLTTSFRNLPSTCVFYVPKNSYNLYKVATNWNIFYSRR